MLRSDGQVLACGDNRYGQCRIPEAGHGQIFCPAVALRDLVVQLVVEGSEGAVRSVSCRRHRHPHTYTYIDICVDIDIAIDIGIALSD